MDNKAIFDQSAPFMVRRQDTGECAHLVGSANSCRHLLWPPGQHVQFYSIIISFDAYPLNELPAQPDSRAFSLQYGLQITATSGSRRGVFS